MAGQDPSEPCSLARAALRWCDKAVLALVLEAERPFSVAELARLERPNLGGAAFAGQRPIRVASGYMEREYWDLDNAWAGLLRDFRQRLASGAFFLFGVSTRPTRDMQRTALPNVWAVDYKFDFLNDVVELNITKRWVSVVATETPIGVASDQQGEGGFQRAIQDLRDQIALMQPEDVALLLEAHAEHVRTVDGVSLAPPGKASPMALVASKMKQRAARGELRPKLSEEAAWLERWCSEVASSYAVPQAKTIGNKLGALYRSLRKT